MVQMTIVEPHRLHVGMVGMGMIFDETYRPLFEQLRQTGLTRRDFGLVEVVLTAVASRSGREPSAIARCPGNICLLSPAASEPRRLLSFSDTQWTWSA